MTKTNDFTSMLEGIVKKVQHDIESNNANLEKASKVVLDTIGDVRRMLDEAIDTFDSAITDIGIVDESIDENAAEDPRRESRKSVRFYSTSQVEAAALTQDEAPSKILDGLESFSMRHVGTISRKDAKELIKASRLSHAETMWAETYHDYIWSLRIQELIKERMEEASARTSFLLANRENDIAALSGEIKESQRLEVQKIAIESAEIFVNQMFE